MICIERLSYMINEMVDKKKWNPFKPVGMVLPSHIIFADDLILMSKAMIADARVIKKATDKFCGSSGLNLNLNKSKKKVLF